MAYTEESMNSLVASIAEFQSKLPADQREAFAHLEKVIEIALSASPPDSRGGPTVSTSSDIVESGKTQALMNLSARYVSSKPIDTASTWTVTTVTTALATSRWLC